MRHVEGAEKRARIFSGVAMPESLQAATDLERGLLAGEGREALARARATKMSLRLGRWRLELVKNAQKPVRRPISGN